MTIDSVSRENTPTHPIGSSEAEPITTTWMIQGAQIHIEVIDGQVYVNGDLVKHSHPPRTPLLPKNE
jgi:hypothetical protein